MADAEHVPSTGSGHRFTAEVLAAGGGGHAVVVPKEIAAALTGRRVPVLTHVDGVEYRSRVAVYGGQVYLGLRKDLLRRIGRQAGDTVEIRLVEAIEPEPASAPELSEPPDLVAALAENPTARTAYADLPPEHQREFWAWIAGAEQPETRAERIARTVRRLSR
jgi:Bacteriocin-protection, YdeI or OmpD-Associated/Domain of unknown function (DUF1905)